MKRNQLVVIVLIVVVAVGAYWLLRQSKPSAMLLGDAVKLFVYTVEGKATGGAVVSIPFVTQDAGQWYMNVLADLDRDNNLEVPAEWVKRNQTTRIRKDYRNNVSFALNGASLKEGEQVLVRVVLSLVPAAEGWNGQAAPKDIVKELRATVAFHDLKILGLNDVEAGIGYLRGPGTVFSLGARPVFAQNQASINVFKENVPDLPQDQNACAPTTMANNVISLAEEHGALDGLYENVEGGPWGIVDGLKSDMKYTAARGVLPANVVPGKQAFIDRLNLPITTQVKENPTVQDIADALSGGAAVEASLALEVGASGRFTGHLLTVVGVSGSANGGQLQVHDGATPDGMDTIDYREQVDVRGHKGPGIDYPLWNGGVEFIDFIIIERWVGEATPASTGPTTSTGEATSLVEMLVINGNYFPRSQFRVANPDRCGSQHYHANRPTVYGLRSKTSTEIVSMSDPARDKCGFGKINEVPVENIPLTIEQSTELIKYVVD